MANTSGAYKDVAAAARANVESLTAKYERIERAIEYARNAPNISVVKGLFDFEETEAQLVALGAQIEAATMRMHYYEELAERAALKAAAGLSKQAKYSTKATKIMLDKAREQRKNKRN